MPVVDHARRTVFFKIVYYGTGLSGKTTNVQTLHRLSRPEHRGRLLSLQSGSERTLFFDLMPVELGRFRDYSIRLHLCTVPGQVAMDQMRRMILRHADAVIFVVDSQPGALEPNMESLRNLDQNLRQLAVDPQGLPLVVQYNKRDLPGVLSTSMLRHWLAIPDEVPQFEASARRGDGVSDTLKAPVKMCLKLLGNPSETTSVHVPSVLPRQRERIYPTQTPKRAFGFLSQRLTA